MIVLNSGRRQHIASLRLHLLDDLPLLLQLCLDQVELGDLLCQFRVAFEELTDLFLEVLDFLGVTLFVVLEALDRSL